MEGVYLISDFKQNLKALSTSINLPEKQVIAFQSFEKEHGYHDWITAIFNENNIKKLIIPISIPTDAAINTAGIMIALHLRLNYELKINQRLIPIVFLSDFTIDKLLISNNFDNDTNPLNLLFSKGVYLSSFDSDTLKSTISKAEPCAAKDYQKQVLSKLKILQKANSGKHSIANAWGCYKLSQVTGLYDTIIKHPGVSEQLKTLYAKYLICYNNTFTSDKFIDLTPINCKGKNILFIDDQADEGWSVLMKNIFKSAGNKFVSVDSSKYKNRETKVFHDYDGFFVECKSHLGKDWDLIIIDLRLNPEKEDIDNEMITPTKFSGYVLIDLFLNSNAGYQIIVSTASNKIWNINAALERGSSSYYVKESPEFNYSVSETNKQYENFKCEVIKCFELKYLMNIWKEFKTIKDHFAVNSPLNKYFPNNLELLKALSYQYLISNELDTLFSILKTNNVNKFNISMLSIFKILESVSEIFIQKDENTNKLSFWDGVEVKYCEYDRRTGKYNLINKNSSIKRWAYDSTENKVHTLLSQRLSVDDLKIHDFVHDLTKYRNDYIHPENRFKLKALDSANIENWCFFLSNILKKI